MSQGRSQEGGHLQGHRSTGLSPRAPAVWLPFPVRSSFQCGQFRGLEAGRRQEELAQGVARSSIQP